MGVTTAMPVATGVEISGLEAVVPVQSVVDKGPARVVVRRGTLRLSAAAVTALLAKANLSLRLEKGYAVLSLVTPGILRVGIEVEVEGSVTAAGRLRIVARRIQAAGFLPVPKNVIGLLRDQLERAPFVHVTDADTIEIDLRQTIPPTLPLRLDIRPVALTVTPAFLQLDCLLE
jgi:hypothetical protein